MRKELSLPCHYKVTLDTNTNSYEFNTNGGAKYSVFFNSDNSIFSGSVLEGADTFHLVVTKLQNGNGVKDIHVVETVDSIVEHFFLIKNRIIYYTCDGSDNRQLARDRMFKIWYTNSAHKERLYKQDYSFDASGTYASIIFDNDNDLGKENILITMDVISSLFQDAK